uniref:Helically-extended SH3 domain-containing protein n=1 Tax=Sander lucioperca TaxID=283035 RepID=A0A8D0AP31_SANLU
MMARFQASGASIDETSSTPAGRIKQPLHPTLSSGPNIQTRKPVLESLSGSAINIPPKPTFLKNTVSTKSDTEAHEPNKAKALASRFENTQDDTNTCKKPFIVNKPLKPPLQVPEANGPLQKPPLSKPFLSSTTSDPKPAFPKPSPAFNSKPSWVKEDSGGGLPQKRSSSFVKLKQQNEESAGAGTNTANTPTNYTFKPPPNFKTVQNTFNKESDSSVKAHEANKPPLTGTNPVSPPIPSAIKKPSIKKPPKPSPQTSSIISDATSGPKRNPLPNSLALGPAPAKPNRPPNVNLESFRRGAVASDNEKDEKEEKKRLEAEKKEQKEREKKEQDARKKFKLVGPLEVVHQGKARLDCRSSKTDLALKQGQSLDIIRVQGNPEGKWLGRTQDGSSKFTHLFTCVYIFFTSSCLPLHHLSPVFFFLLNMSLITSCICCCPVVVLPPLPGDEGEIYDDVIDPNLDSFTNQGKSLIKNVKIKCIHSHNIDDVILFQYEGGIKVLYQVTITPTLTNKKWGVKELPVKAGETLDVIVKAVDNKLICRNEEGKCEYLDGDIYDDIGDGMFSVNLLISSYKYIICKYPHSGHKSPFLSMFF